ncbi:MAG: cytochrome c oxidase subunit 3 family protein [Planctomycetota bacterium]
MSDGHALPTTPTPAGFVPHEVAHHYNSHVQEYQSWKLAFWLFLATEIMLFGGLFAAYFVYHDLYPETFRVGGQQLDWRMGSLNTAILLCSSFTMALGVRAAQTSEKGKMLTYMILTVAGAAGFMVVKYFEYTAKFSHGLFPGAYFNPHGAYADAFAGLSGANIFFGLYFTMTGIHGLHVLIGAGLILWMIKRGAAGRYHSGHYLPVDIAGLYWHLVDLIWIFLFPLLYLVP